MKDYIYYKAYFEDGTFGKFAHISEIVAAKMRSPFSKITKIVKIMSVETEINSEEIEQINELIDWKK